MSYKQIKWLILIIPTVTIGLWEYVRHQFLLPYISMDLGNWLAPVIVFAVTVTLLRKLFKILEQNQEELNREKATKAALEERERMARELHDGIAQSLFLLSVQVDQLEEDLDASQSGRYQGVRKTAHHMNEYVRQAIASLRFPVQFDSTPWMESLEKLVEELQEVTDLQVSFDWQLVEEKLSAKEKIELYATIREALINIRKHASASKVTVHSYELDDGWICEIADDGIGFPSNDAETMEMHALQVQQHGYGLQIMHDRAKEMKWQLTIKREAGHTVIRVIKRGN